MTKHHKHKHHHKRMQDYLIYCKIAKNPTDGDASRTAEQPERQTVPLSMVDYDLVNKDNIELVLFQLPPHVRQQMRTVLTSVVICCRYCRTWTQNLWSAVHRCCSVHNTWRKQKIIHHNTNRWGRSWWYCPLAAMCPHWQTDAMYVARVDRHVFHVCQVRSRSQRSLWSRMV